MSSCIRYDHSSAIHRRLVNGNRSKLSLSYAAVRDSSRPVIYAVRINGASLQPHEIDDVAARMRERLAKRGEVPTDIVVLQGEGKTLRLYGVSYSVTRVRAAMFNAAISWTPVDLGYDG